MQKELLKKLDSMEAHEEQTFKLCVERSPPGGMLLEFGVATGDTINQIAAYADGRTVYGFDSFDGLPEDWFGPFRKGHFECYEPDVASNVVLVKGLFQDTLPEFMAKTVEPIGFAHIDCDLYSSTKCILDCIKARLIVGSILLFDELVRYPSWEQHEWRALCELLAEGFEAEPLWRRTEHAYALRVSRVP